MKYKVFVDGQEGTTGLEINQRLCLRDDIEILKIDSDKKKDLEERSKYINNADIVFLCLPDVAARESVSLVKNNSVRIIDASTAHRTDDNWAYGIPELSISHREKIRDSKRISVPGCFASGFNMIVYPLVNRGFIPADYPASCHAVTGYSGGGKALIEAYENAENSDWLESPCFYALGLGHKHLPEMAKRSGLDNPPLFTPILGKYYRGMTVAVPLHPKLFNKKANASEICEFYEEYYFGQHFVKVMPFNSHENFRMGYLDAKKCNNTNKMELYVFGDENQILVTAVFDNLGKGASGAAVQNMNIILNQEDNFNLL